MSVRAINQIVVHLQSFRNIDLWFQGLYFLSIQILYQPPTLPSTQPKTVNAHPFAHTENFHPNQQSKKYYDHQVVKTSYVDQNTSRFISKSFIVKYYEEQIQLNDICHFRIETGLNDPNPQIILIANLHFGDLSQKKSFQKMDERQKDLLYRESKIAKSQKYYLNSIQQGTHEFVPLIFDQNYFSLVNMSVHTICLDYRFRVSNLQLSEFSRLSFNEKMKMIQANNKMFAEGGKKKISFYLSILKDLGLPDKPASLKNIQNLLVGEMKAGYSAFLFKYNNLFIKVITENQRKLFSSRLTSPNVLPIFEDQSMIKSEPEALYTKYRASNPQQLVEKMLEQTSFISTQYLKLWHCYIDLFKISPRFSIAYLEAEYHSKKREFWSKMVYLNKVTNKNIFQGFPQSQTKQIQKHLLAQKMKARLGINVQQQLLMSRREQLPVLIENIHYIIGQEQRQRQRQKKSYRIKGFEDREKDKEKGEKDDGIHLIVFVHGFQGNSFDMKLIKNYVSFLYPESMFLCATSNQDQTDNDIFQMGDRLAHEVKNFIHENFPQNSLSRLSFIGHSLGGLKIRAALPKLLQYKDKFHCLLTFSSPHLGYSVNASSVVEAGLWVLQKMKNSICLKQLSMTDSEIPQQTCLYKLSQSEGLQYFKNIFLFSSKQDSYAPFQSARIQIPSDFLGDKSKQLHCRMVRNALKGVKSGVLRRINVIFQIGEKNLDSIIGRTAHILFLQNQELMRAILYTEPELLA